MELASRVRQYKDRLRIYLILCFFSEDYSDPAQPKFRKLFRSEVRIQKIDFLIRNPDYLAYELLSIAKADASKRDDIKLVIRNIFDSKEPVIRRLEMERFFFGAYEDIDDVVGFLQSIDFIKFTSKKAADLKTIEKHYYLTDHGLTKLQTVLPTLPALDWYLQRCELIKKYFGDMTGTQLKVAQYRIKEYREATYNSYISDIQDTVRTEFATFYAESL
jgi:hypothetical protein